MTEHLSPPTTERANRADHAPAAQALWRRVREQGMTTVAVMGLAKNTGKTVALNHLLACAAADGVRVGLSSIGRDGEATDAVFQQPKPPVVVAARTLVATASGTLQRSRVRTRRLGGTGIATPMGEVLLVEALEAGEMEVAGASRSADQRATIALLRRCGATLVLLDGALGRSQHASPAIADGVLLATGAALGGGLADVLRKTRDRLALLTVPALEEPWRSRQAGVLAQGSVGLWRRDGALHWQADIVSLNAAPRLLDQAAGAELGAVAVGGAVGRRLWQALEALASRHPGLIVGIADGTRLFVDGADLAMLAARGARLGALHPVCLAGLTTNPWSPLGGHLDGRQLLQAAREAFAEHVVCDVLLAPDALDTHPLNPAEAPHGPLAA